MELRHLRYFVAVAEEGSLLTAAQRRLNTSQPSLSRQIRDLESEVGVKLLERQPRGVALTAAGRVFLDHARLALLQVEAATDGARRVEQPEKPAFSMGFLAGQEVVWLPHALRIIREEAPEVEITLCSQASPDLAVALMRGKLDVAFLRHEAQTVGLSFKLLAKEPLIAVLPADHRLTSRKKNPTAGSRSRNLRQFGENRSGVARRNTGLRVEGRDHAQGRIRRRHPTFSDVTCRVHRRGYAYSTLCAKYAHAECRRPSPGRRPSDNRPHLGIQRGKLLALAPPTIISFRRIGRKRPKSEHHPLR
jgi:DNA-binding transcriptional LysR family regulator